MQLSNALFQCNHVQVLVLHVLEHVADGRIGPLQNGLGDELVGALAAAHHGVNLLGGGLGLDEMDLALHLLLDGGLVFGLAGLVVLHDVH